MKGISLNKHPRWVNVALFLTTWLVGLSVISFFAISASYEERLARMSDRMPYTMSTSGEPQFFAAGMNATCDGMPVDVLRVRPITDQSPLPPGAAQWPAPGEALASPAVYNSGCELGVGDYVGMINPSYLSDPGELVVYSNPLEDALIDMRFEQYTHWGKIPDHAFQGDELRFLNILGSPQYDQKITLFYGLWAITFALPLLLAFVAIAGTYQNSLNRRDFVLHLIGVSSFGRFRHRVHHFYKTIFAAGAVNILTCLLLTQVDVIIPITKFHFTGGDLKESLFPLLTALFLLPFILTLSAGILTASRKVVAKKGLPRKFLISRTAVILALLCLGLSILLIIFSNPFMTLLPSGMFELVLMISLVGTAIFSAGLVSETCIRVIQSGKLRKKAQTSGTMLMSVGLLRSSTSAIVGFASAVTATIILVTFTTSFYEAFSRSDEDAIGAFDKYHNNIARIDRPPVSEAGIKKFEAVLTEFGVDFVLIHTQDSGQYASTVYAPTSQPQLTGSKTASGRCTFTGSDRLLSEYLSTQFFIDGDCTVSTDRVPIADYSKRGSVIYIAYATTDSLTRDAIQSRLIANFAVPSILELPGEDYLVGGNVLAAQGKWLILGSILLIFLLLGTMWIFSAADFQTCIVKIIPYLQLGAPASLIWKVLAARLFLPTGIALIWAAISGSAIAIGFQVLFTGLGPLMWHSLGISLLFLLLLSGTVWAALSIAVMRQNIHVPAYLRVNQNHE